MIEVISASCAVNISMREPGNLKKRKFVRSTKSKSFDDRIYVPKDTTSDHYIQFINGTMDIIDEFPEMQEFLIVMDNASIYAPFIIDPIIIKREYAPVYLLPYSPELNY